MSHTILFLTIKQEFFGVRLSIFLRNSTEITTGTCSLTERLAGIKKSHVRVLILKIFSAGGMKYSTWLDHDWNLLRGLKFLWYPKVISLHHDPDSISLDEKKKNHCCWLRKTPAIWLMIKLPLIPGLHYVWSFWGLNFPLTFYIYFIKKEVKFENFSEICRF